MTDPKDRPRLDAVGQVYVTLAAARQYAEAARTVWADGQVLELETARRELTEMLLDAKRVQGDTSTPERWRFRRSSLGVDVSARVQREGRLMVVISVTARAYSSARTR